VLNPLEFQPVMAWAPLAMLGLGAVAGLVPAAKAYRTDVAENLTPIS
jgi:putative ABC transport system permease protein